MRLNADFTRRVIIHARELDWIASPMAGVDRKMLDRIGDEVARATSIVRYAPASSFSPHTHGGGEEFLVLDGVFQDEHGDYPAGSYVRNPPSSRHTPGSAAGCTIFVKLWQFDPADRHGVRLTSDAIRMKPTADRPGVAAAVLHRDGRETVRIEEWEPRASICLRPAGGIELLCLEGSLTEGGETLVEQSWLRLPVGANLIAQAGPEGCRIWLKEGHLRFVEAPGE